MTFLPCWSGAHDSPDQRRNASLYIIGLLYVVSGFPISFHVTEELAYGSLALDDLGSPRRVAEGWRSQGFLVGAVPFGDISYHSFSCHITGANVHTPNVICHMVFSGLFPDEPWGNTTLPVRDEA